MEGILVFKQIREFYEDINNWIKEEIDNDLLMGFTLFMFKLLFWLILLTIIVILILKWKIGVAVLIIIILIEFFNYYGKKHRE